MPIRDSLSLLSEELAMRLVQTDALLVIHVQQNTPFSAGRKDSLRASIAHDLHGTPLE